MAACHWSVLRGQVYVRKLFAQCSQPIHHARTPTDIQPTQNRDAELNLFSVHLLLQMLELPENSTIRSQLAALVAQLQGKPRSSNGAVAAVQSAASAIMGAVTGSSASATNGNGASSSGGHVHAADVLGRCRELAMKVHVSPQLRTDLAARMQVRGHAHTHTCARARARMHMHGLHCHR